jgi:hypothetical protein
MAEQHTRRTGRPPNVIVLLRDTKDSATRWAARGLGPVTVVPGLAWTLVVPAGPPRSSAPYDDELALLGGRPVPRRLRPTACLVADPDRLAIQLQASTWRAPTRWVVWSRGIGLIRVGDLEFAPPELVGRLLAPTRASGDRVLQILTRDGREPAAVADELLAALALPGEGVLSGRVDAARLPGAVRVEPGEHRVARFDAEMRDQERAKDQGGRR